MCTHVQVILSFSLFIPARVLLASYVELRGFVQQVSSSDSCA